MSATETLENSHVQVLQAIEDLPETLWDVEGVSGHWSTKDVISHLTAYELLLIDVINAVQGDTASPYLLRWIESQKEFDQETIDARRYKTAQEVENEYQDAQVRSSALLASLPPEAIDRSGMINSVLNVETSDERSLAELINVLAQHTRQHCNQVMQFREQNKELEESKKSE
jgi:uncharacterized damage-inducible protein DinB